MAGLAKAGPTGRPYQPPTDSNQRNKGADLPRWTTGVTLAGMKTPTRACLVLMAALAFVAARGAEIKAPPLATWTLKGPLPTTPQRLDETLPLSDQTNRSGWTRVEAFWDEFNGTALDTNKWARGLDWWTGRQPAWFNPSNVTVQGGELRLAMRRDTPPAGLVRQGYTNYSSAALHSVARAGYGYYEIRSQAMGSAGSSAFWFQVEETPGWLTEIDVFELCGRGAVQERVYNMNAHVFRAAGVEGHWDNHAEWAAPWRWADGWHVFGFEWGAEELRWYVDGVLLHTQANTHWHNPLFLIFDSETMPEWFGMPVDADLPSTFRIDYVRAWKKRGP